MPKQDLGSTASSAVPISTGSKAVPQLKWCVVDERGDGGFLYVERGPDFDALQIYEEDHARLIASAPDLLEALILARRRFAESLGLMPESCTGGPFVQINAAIAKAEGR